MNRRAFLAAAGLATLAPARVLGATAGGRVVALVTADLESHIAALDVTSGRIVKRITTPPGPRSVEGSPFGTALVAHTAHGLVTLVDGMTLSARATLGGFREPRYTAMHPTERLAYVTDSARREVVTVDLVRRSIVHRAEVPGPARHISVDPAGRWLWTALGTKAARVAVLDLASPRRPRLRRLLAPPFLAHDVVFTTSGRHAWLTSGSDEAIAVYRLDGMRIRTLRADAPPQHLAFSDDRAYVASGKDGTLETRRLDGSVLRVSRVPPGSYNLASQPATLVTPSLDRGTVCMVRPSGAVRLVRRVARSAHDACLVPSD